MASRATGSIRPRDIDRIVVATITLMSVLIFYDGWKDLRFIGVVGLIVGPMLAIYLSHVFSATLRQQLTLGRPVTMPEWLRMARSESRFLLICISPVLVLGIVVILGVSISDAIVYLLALGTGSLGYWGGRAGREAGLTGWRLAWAILWGLLVGALILSL
jgi:hypothetical protein